MKLKGDLILLGHCYLAWFLYMNPDIQFTSPPNLQLGLLLALLFLPLFLLLFFILFFILFFLLRVRSCG